MTKSVESQFFCSTMWLLEDFSKQLEPTTFLFKFFLVVSITYKRNMMTVQRKGKELGNLPEGFQ